MEERTNLLCISLRSASGLNLQRATCVVFGELDWSPAVHSQAEDRAHRIGQKDSLLCYYLVSPKGSDRDMQDSLGLKVSQFVAIMGDTPASEEDQFMQQTVARDRIRRLVEKLDSETQTEAAQGEAEAEEAPLVDAGTMEAQAAANAAEAALPDLPGPDAEGE